MTAMRPRRAVRGRIATVLGAVAVLAGCTTAGEAVSPRPSAWQPGDVPDVSSLVHTPAAQRGDCPAEADSGALVTLVVTSGDLTAPVEVTYPVFRTDGTSLVRRMTQPGPVITVVLGDCGGGTKTPMRFVATTGSGALACALFVGGELITAAEGDRRVECEAAGSAG